MNIKTKSNRFFHFEHWKLIALVIALYDIIVVSLSYFAALWLRFDCKYSLIPEEYLNSWLKFAPYYALFSITCFYFLRLYRSMWRFASYSELMRITLSSVITGVFHAVFITIFIMRMPISYYIIGFVIQFGAILIIRFSYRFVLLLKKESHTGEGSSNVMLIGAGDAGQMILRDVNRAKELNDRVVCIIDDSENKWNRFIDGIPIVGGRDTILENVEKFNIQKIYVALPSASMEERRDILSICKAEPVEKRLIFPGYHI